MAKANGHPRPVSDLTTTEIDELLDSGERADELAAFFGPAEFENVRRKPARRLRQVRGNPRRVFVLPGIMGSTLGSPGETIWVNLFRLARGRVTELSLKDGQIRHEALDVIPFVYHSLRRRLSAEGFEPVYFPFDWRLDLETLGQRFAEALAAEPAPVDVIGHSMGGLVARLALRDPAASANVSRLIMMGTPNGGSFEAVRVFDGTHGLAKRVADLDFAHSRAELLEELFVTLPGIYQLLPHRTRFEAAGVYDTARWPDQGPGAPNQELLTRAEAVTNLYPAPDARHYLIASTDHETTAAVRVEPSGVSYEMQAASGDGTVPFASAFLAGVKTKFVGAEHMWLPRDGDAQDAAVAVLLSEPAEWADDGFRRSAGATRTVTADEPVRAAATLALKRRADNLTAAEQRELLEATFGAPPTAQPPAPATVAASAPVTAAAPRPETVNLTGGRILERPRRRLEVVLARGSLADAEERVGVVGLFQNVQAGGAAGSIDALTGGAVSDLRDRRMFDAQAGQVFMLPTPTRRVGADFILLLGLGKYEELTESVYRFAAANVVRTLVRCKFRELATVVPGTNSTLALADALRLLLTGLIAGLEDADPDRHFRRVTICEIEPARQEELKRVLVQMATTGEFGNTEVMLNEVTLAGSQPPAGETTRGVASSGPRPAYLSVRGTVNESDEETKFEYSLLTPGGNATVFRSSKVAKTAALDAVLKKFAPVPKDLAAAGQALAEAVLPSDLHDVLASPDLVDKHLTFVNDELSSRLPWEALPAFDEGGTPPALGGGVSRLLEASGLSVARWSQARRAADQFRVLLIVNPTDDLPGAAAEGKAVAKILAGVTGVAVEQLVGAAATRDAVKAAFTSGRYDCVHYAGHAHFDPADIGQSGLKCADGTLTGRDVAALTPLPTLLVFNACESGRVRRDGSLAPSDESAKLRIDRTVSFAEAFLRNGVAQFVGTYWPVGDDSAAKFGKVFYAELAGGAAVGAALRTARHAVKDDGSDDWADYIHYGDPHFALKTRG